MSEPWGNATKWELWRIIQESKKTDAIWWRSKKVWDELNVRAEKAEAERDALEAEVQDQAKLIEDNQALRARVADLEERLGGWSIGYPPSVRSGGRESGRAEGDASGRATAPVRESPGTIATPKLAAADPPDAFPRTGHTVVHDDGEVCDRDLHELVVRLTERIEAYENSGPTALDEHGHTVPRGLRCTQGDPDDERECAG